jgi:hypothetical protein
MVERNRENADGGGEETEAPEAPEALLGTEGGDGFDTRRSLSHFT